MNFHEGRQILVRFMLHMQLLASLDLQGYNECCTQPHYFIDLFFN